MWKDTFLLTYNIPGLNYQAVEGMGHEERYFYMNEFVEAKKREAEAMKSPK